MPCAASSPITLGGLNWYYDKANRQKAIEARLGTSRNRRKEVLRRGYFATDRGLLSRSKRLRVGGSNSEADRRDDRGEAHPAIRRCGQNIFKLSYLPKRGAM